MSVYDGFETRLRELAEELRGQDFIAPLRAEAFVAMMEKEHPNELRAWMRQRAVAHATDQLTQLFMRRRATAARRFSGAIDRYIESGDESELRIYTDMTFVIDDNNTRRPLGKMSGSDCDYAATRYSKDIKTLLMTQAFLRELGKRVGPDQVVSDVLPEIEAAKILNTLQGGNVDFHNAALNNAA